MWLLYTGQT